MASTVPAIVWPINFDLPSGNPLCQSINSATALDSAQLIQGDQRVLQIYFLQPPAQEGGVTRNVNFLDGTTLSVESKLTNDLGATILLFEAATFTRLQDAANLFFYQTFLDLNKQEIGDAFAAAGNDQNTLPVTVEITATVPAQAVTGDFPAVPIQRARYQIAASLKRQVYTGSESSPTPATPPYPTPAQVNALVAGIAIAPSSDGNPTLLVGEYGHLWTHDEAPGDFWVGNGFNNGDGTQVLSGPNTLGPMDGAALINVQSVTTSITSVGDGADGSLEAVPTVGLAVPVYRTIDVNDTLQDWKLTASTAANSADADGKPAVRRPLDFNAASNAKIWFRKR